MDIPLKCDDETLSQTEYPAISTPSTRLAIKELAIRFKDWKSTSACLPEIFVHPCVYDEIYSRVDYSHLCSYQLHDFDDRRMAETKRQHLNKLDCVERKPAHDVSHDNTGHHFVSPRPCNIVHNERTSASKLLTILVQTEHSTCETSASAHTCVHGMRTSYKRFDNRHALLTKYRMSTT
jgi:hypothetical protein